MHFGVILDKMGNFEQHSRSKWGILNFFNIDLFSVLLCGFSVCTVVNTLGCLKNLSSQLFLKTWWGNFERFLIFRLIFRNIAEKMHGV